MPNTRQAKAVRLEFVEGALVHSNLSGAAASGDWLFVAGDEACGIDRLRRLTPVADEKLRYGEVEDFPLAELLALPGAADDEADLEGMALQDDWLWVVGSHGLKRKNIKDGKSDADNAKRLSKTSLDANRRLLACVPVQTDKQGVPQLLRDAADGRQAAVLKGDARDNELTLALASDPHIGPYMAIPGKDNGFDVEGLTLLDDTVLLGLRGPVLRGWTVLLQVAVQRRGRELRLKALNADGSLVRKHFLPLDGLGIRDLHFDGDDLFILAGPTMVLNGEIRLYKWAQARSALRACTEAAHFAPELAQSVVLPHSRGANRAEAICRLPDALGGGAAQWMVLYDAPGPERRDGEYTVFGDLLQHG